MAYFLGIDLGTTFTAAAIWRDGRVMVARLGSHASVIPSVVLLREDGQVITGEAAERRSLIEPQRVAREFKRRIGDPTPLFLGGTPYSAETLMAKLLRWVVDRVAEDEGGPPDGITVCHPANWGEYKKDLLKQAIHLADLADANLLTEPEAAAIHYASLERIQPGAVVAVYDLGGGTFDAAVLRRTGVGWEILGFPEGVERLGGVDFDAAVQRHVVRSVGEAYDALDTGDMPVLAAVARLRQECVSAKEALTADTDVSIPVMLPSLHTEVRLTRREFEDMIKPALAESIAALERALRSAALTPDDVGSVLLVGGSSRIPLVSELVGSALGRPVAVDDHPKHSVAMGAALVAAETGLERVSSGVHAILPEVVGAAVGAGPGAVGVGGTAVAALPVADLLLEPVTPADGLTIPGLDHGLPADPDATPHSGVAVEPQKPPLALLIGGVAALVLVVLVGLMIIGGSHDDDTPRQQSPASPITQPGGAPGTTPGGDHRDATNVTESTVPGSVPPAAGASTTVPHKPGDSGHSPSTASATTAPPPTTEPPTTEPPTTEPPTTEPPTTEPPTTDPTVP